MWWKPLAQQFDTIVLDSPRLFARRAQRARHRRPARRADPRQYGARWSRWHSSSPGIAICRRPEGAGAPRRHCADDGRLSSSGDARNHRHHPPAQPARRFATEIPRIRGSRSRRRMDFRSSPMRRARAAAAPTSNSPPNSSNGSGAARVTPDGVLHGSRECFRIADDFLTSHFNYRIISG